MTRTKRSRRTKSRAFRQWFGGTSWPSDGLIGLEIREELQTIVDRRHWELT